MSLDVVIGAGVSVGYLAIGTGVAYCFLKSHAMHRQVDSDDVIGCFGANMLAWPIVVGVVAIVYVKEKLEDIPKLNVFKRIADHFNKGRK